MNMTIINVSVRDDRDRKSPTARVFISPVNETLIANLFNRRNRPYDVYRTFLPKIVEMSLGVSPEEAKELAKDAKWRQKAGCNCGCSPGFILPNFHLPLNLFGTIAPVVEETSLG